MGYSVQYQAVLDDKNRFFSGLANHKFKGTTGVRRRAYSKQFQFVAINKLWLEEELIQIYGSLKSSSKKREEFWLYCYYCSILLEEYHIAYSQPQQAAEYRKLRRQIWHHYHGTRAQAEAVNLPLVKRLGNAVARDVKNMAATPVHLSQLRQQITFYNILRSSTAYSRLALANSLNLLKDSKLLPLVEKLINRSINIAAVTASLNASIVVFRPLSIGFFITRLLLNSSMLLKHTFKPTTAEKELSLKQRLFDEVYKRHVELTRDAIWTVVNGIGNYAHIFHIPLKVAGWLTMIFLALDVAISIWSRYLAKREYLIKKAQYQDELKRCLAKLEGDLSKGKRLLLIQRCELLQAQLAQLEISWQVKNYSLWFNVLACALMLIGFTAALIITSPLLVIACYFLCILSNSICLTDGAYRQYQEKSLLLQQAKMNNMDTANLTKEYRTALINLIITLVKYTVIPILLIGTFAVSWQASLVVLALYVGYELYKTANKKNASFKPAKLPAMDHSPLEESAETEASEQLEEEQISEPKLERSLTM